MFVVTIHCILPITVSVLQMLFYGVTIYLFLFRGTVVLLGRSVYGVFSYLKLSSSDFLQILFYVENTLSSPVPILALLKSTAKTPELSQRAYAF
jgi:hypothetical protein